MTAADALDDDHDTREGGSGMRAGGGSQGKAGGEVSSGEGALNAGGQNADHLVTFGVCVQIFFFRSVHYTSRARVFGCVCVLHTFVRSLLAYVHDRYGGMYDCVFDFGENFRLRCSYTVGSCFALLLLHYPATVQYPAVPCRCSLGRVPNRNEPSSTLCVLSHIGGGRFRRRPSTSK